MRNDSRWLEAAKAETRATLARADGWTPEAVAAHWEAAAIYRAIGTKRAILRARHNETIAINGRKRLDAL